MKDRFEREEQFDRIYRAYESVIYKVAMNQLKDKHAASDVVQETFCNFHDRMDDVSETGVKAYLVVTARHLASNYVRDKKHEVESEEIDLEAVKVEIPLESAEEKYLCSEQRKLEIQLGAEIFEALRDKNENWYHIMYMIYVEDLSYDEIIEKLNISKEVLYCRLYRAKEWIQKKYGYKFEDIKAFT